eukprot:8885669-Karenia_brevis.AAC.1
MVRFTCAVIGAWKLPVVRDQRMVSGTNVGMPSRLGGDTLVPYSLNARWKEHSERAVLNTWTATL